jgi:hypothetical protein
LSEVDAQLDISAPSAAPRGTSATAPPSPNATNSWILAFKRLRFDCGLTYLLRTGLGATVLPLSLYWLAVYSRANGTPTGMDLVGRGELYILAMGATVNALPALVNSRSIAVRGRHLLELELLIAVGLCLASIVVWAGLVGNDIDGQDVTASQRDLATWVGAAVLASAVAFGAMVQTLNGTGDKQ